MDAQLQKKDMQRRAERESERADTAELQVVQMRSVVAATASHSGTPPSSPPKAIMPDGEAGSAEQSEGSPVSNMLLEGMEDVQNELEEARLELTVTRVQLAETSTELEIARKELEATKVKLTKEKERSSKGQAFEAQVELMKGELMGLEGQVELLNGVLEEKRDALEQMFLQKEAVQEELAATQTALEEEMSKEPDITVEASDTLDLEAAVAELRADMEASTASMSVAFDEKAELANQLTREVEGARAENEALRSAAHWAEERAERAEEELGQVNSKLSAGQVLQGLQEAAACMEGITRLQRRSAAQERLLGGLEAAKREVEGTLVSVEQEVGSVKARLDAAEDAAGTTYGQVVLTLTLTLTLTLIGWHDIWAGGGSVGAQCGANGGAARGYRSRIASHAGARGCPMGCPPEGRDAAGRDGKGDEGE